MEIVAEDRWTGRGLERNWIESINELSSRFMNSWRVGVFRLWPTATAAVFDELSDADGHRKRRPPSIDYDDRTWTMNGPIPNHRLGLIGDDVPSTSQEEQAAARCLQLRNAVAMAQPTTSGRRWFMGDLGKFYYYTFIMELQLLFPN